MSKQTRKDNGERIILRIIWMLLFFGIWHLAVPLLGIVIILQLIYRLILGRPSNSLVSFGDSLSQYLAQMGRFAVFSTEEKPWPVADWPQPEESLELEAPIESKPNPPKDV